MGYQVTEDLLGFCEDDMSQFPIVHSDASWSEHLERRGEEVTDSVSVIGTTTGIASAVAARLGCAHGGR